MPDIFDGLPADRRKDIYTTAASISALVGGFGTAAIAQYASSHGRDMRELRRRFGGSLRKNWSSILSGMLLISAGCLLLLTIDRTESAGFASWLAEAMLVLGGARSVRLVWLFNMLIKVSDRDALEPERSPALTFRNRADD
ncbi:TMEM134 family protein [Streptomyces rimosus]|uniref:TMEM134 family protein n=1 Tax=Streptomyces rimosus TaxID=1927 RepID=UPI001F161A61|nr:TMEM134 family protein [Streptomyces rimosus]